MRIGLMVGSDKERPRAGRLTGLVDDGKAAESQGFASFWIPQVPGYLDAMTAVALLGQVTERIEIGTAVVPIQTRHPLIMAQQALTTQVACAGRFTLGLGPSHHWIVDGQLGLPYERPARFVRDYLDVLDAALAGPGAVAVDNDSFRVHSPVDVTDAYEVPVLIAALGPTMLRIAGERTGGTILWMADERAIGDYVVPSITKAATAAGRSKPGSSQAFPSRCAPTTKSVTPARTPARCSAMPTSPPTTSGCSNTATQKTSATPWRQATNRLSSPGCAATGTRALPISLFAWCHSDRTRTHAVPRGAELRSSWRRCSPNFVLGHSRPRIRSVHRPWCRRTARRRETRLRSG